MTGMICNGGTAHGLLEDLTAHHIHVNYVHHGHIAQIYTLPIFNGNKTLGQWIGWARAQVVLSNSEMGDVTNTGVLYS